MASNKKYFCVGLHKTGTTTLHEYALKFGLKSTNRPGWDKNPRKIKLFDFFCDGGSHYNGIGEINHIYLYNRYPNSIVIINIRNVRSWIISKLKHAGWNENTVIVSNRNNMWRLKTLRNIRLFIRHFYDRYIKLLKTFLNKQDRVYVVDVCGKRMDNLKKIFGRDTIPTNIHKNRGKKTKLHNKILRFIDYEINVTNKNKHKVLMSLLEQYNY